MRFAEEALELAASVGLRSPTLMMIAQRVYATPKGDRRRELGQAMLTLELLAEVLAFDPHRAAADEFARIQAIPQEEWARRHKTKVDMGMAK